MTDPLRAFADYLRTVADEPSQETTLTQARSLLRALPQPRLAVHLLHKDPATSVGGLERYVSETSSYLRNEHLLESLYVFPSEERRTPQLCESRLAGKGFRLPPLSPAALGWFLSSLVRCGLLEISSVTAHQTVGWEHDDLISLFRQLGDVTSKRNVVVHDYVSVCEQHNLMWNNERFCEAPPNPSSPSAPCRTCSFGATVDRQRAFSRELFDMATKVACPSETALSIITKVFPECAPKAVVIPHLTWSEVPGASRGGDATLPAIFFLGATGKTKGIERFRALVQEFGASYRFYTVGVEDHFAGSSLAVKHIHFDIREGEGLDKVVTPHLPGFAFLGSIVPETFSFTAHEAMQSSLPILTTVESGNIAAIVEKSGFGLVFAEYEELQRFLSDPAAVVNSMQHHSHRRFNIRSNHPGWASVYIK